MADYNTVKANLAKTAARNQTYGKAGKQLLDQSVVPMGPSPTGAVSPPRQPYKSPGSLFRATENPDEPITSGLNSGPGLSSAGAGIPMYSARDNALQEIQVILQSYPNDDLYDLVARYGGG